jgi:hypothetical protein
MRNDASVQRLDAAKSECEGALQSRRGVAHMWCLRCLRDATGEIVLLREAPPSPPVMKAIAETGATLR